MYFIRQQQHRLEPLLLLLLGLICGIGMSKLLQFVRLQFYQDISSQTDLTEISELMYVSGNSQHLPATDMIASENNATQRILCIILIEPKRTNQEHIERTWGRRCHELVFLKSQADNDKQGVVGLAVKKRHSNSWGRTRESLQHIYKEYGIQYDWFLLVQDETYIIMENLQHFLLDYAPEMPIYFDSNDWTNMKKAYKSGSDSYIFSKEALHRFVTFAHGNSSICSSRDYGMKHVEIARCFRNVGVSVGNASDELGLPLFAHKLSNISLGSCSTSAISFHCVNVECFYQMDYFVYKLRPFGLN